MNISESLKHVLKNKSSSIFSELWRNDLKLILINLGNDLTHIYKFGASSLKDVRKRGFSFSVKDIKESFLDVVLIFKVFPGRVKNGFLYFKDAFLNELDKQESSKAKTAFSLKVLAALTSFSIETLYTVKKGSFEFRLKGVNRRSAFTKFIVAELVFKVSQLFINKILIEVDKELTDDKDKKRIRYFRDLISRHSEHDISSTQTEEDSAIEIVEDLKRFIMTGQRNKTIS